MGTNLAEASGGTSNVGDKRREDEERNGWQYGGAGDRQTDVERCYEPQCWQEEGMRTLAGMGFYGNRTGAGDRLALGVFSLFACRTRDATQASVLRAFMPHSSIGVISTGHILVYKAERV